MKRRDILKRLMVLPAVRISSGFSSKELAESKLKRFGLQLSTITANMAADFEGTLREVAAIGYQQVEFSALGYLGREVTEVKELLAKYKLSAPVGRVAFKVAPDFMTMPRDQQMKVFSSQSSLDSLRDRIVGSLKECKVMDQKYLIIPAILPHVFSDMTQIKNMLELLKESAKICRDQGVLLGYHNHNWEFDEVDGTIPFEMMLNELDPESFTFQLDTYWIRKAGRNLDQMLSQYSGRFVTCHLKDIDQAGDFEDVGHGEINFPLFVREAIKQGAKYFFVERDTSEEPMESIRRSFRYLEVMKY